MMFAIGGFFLIRGMAYRDTVAWSEGLPAPLQQVFDAVSSHGVLLLLALFGLAALVARSHGLLHLARGVAAGCGVVLAYLSSETIKVVVSQLRPCRNFDVRTIAACPEATDWSWPSNDATIAFAIAVAVLAMSSRLGLIALPWAGLIAASRVVVGVHYVHDVLAGALLAAVVVVCAARWGTPLAHRLLERLARIPLLRPLLEPSTRSRTFRPAAARTAPHPSRPLVPLVPQSGRRPRIG